MINFCFDKLATNNIGYPNLATWRAEPYTPGWRQFEQHYPRVVPLRLLMYMKWTNQPWTVSTVDQMFVPSWYPVALGWFDFSFDYFGAMSDIVKNKIQQQEIKILFYYHEGDNPLHIKTRLDSLVNQHSLPKNCYIFVSANTASEKLENFVYFPDHELFFGYLNRDQHFPRMENQKKYDFTLLSRTHKAWRASVVSDLWRHDLLKNSIWSYGLVNDSTDEGEDPIESLSCEKWAAARQRFIDGAPYKCDTFNSSQQNDHHNVNVELYQSSHCHIVLETHFDADQSGGTFLTEKTFKCLKYGQPFVIVGPAGSLQALRHAGYQVFDGIIDNYYDTIDDNNQRWQAVKHTIQKIKSHSNLERWFKSCLADLQHNKELFRTRPSLAVNNLIKKLTWINQ